MIRRRTPARASEARDLGDVDRFRFYDHFKSCMATPPDVLRVDEKNLREHYVQNCCGIIITSNHKTDGIFLPADDRRHFVAWSDLSRDDFDDGYWPALWHWYEHGGYADVAACLAELDISEFDPTAPPPKTPTFWDIVDANRAPEGAELADVLDDMERPDAITLEHIMFRTVGREIDAWLRDRKNRIPSHEHANDQSHLDVWRYRGRGRRQNAIPSAAWEVRVCSELAAANERFPPVAWFTRCRDIPKCLQLGTVAFATKTPAK